MPGVHRANHAQVVNNAGRLGQELGDLRAALAVPGKFPGAAEELLAGPVDEAEGDLAAVIRPMQPAQLGLGVKQVDVRRSPVHEQRDHRRGLGREMRRAVGEIQRQVLARLPRRVGEQPCSRIR